MSERRQAAWDEAQRRYPTGDRQAGFVAGAAWADDNPKPRTITREQYEQADGWLDAGEVLSEVLESLGIEVRND